MAEQEIANLRDLGKIVKEIRKKVQDFKADDVRLSEGFKKAFTKYMNTLGDKNGAEFKKNTAIITNKVGQKIYAPNYCFLLATYAVELIRETDKYRSYTEKVVDKILKTDENWAKKYKSAIKSADKSKVKESLYQKLKDKGNEDIKDKFKSLTLEYLENEGMVEEEAKKNTDLLYRFVTDDEWWCGGKTINRGDYYVSPTLGALNLENASHEYVATKILKAYLVDENLRNELSTIIDSESDGNMNFDFDEENRQVFQGWATGLSTDFERNRIVFGAPGTGKSYKLKEDAEALLKNSKGTFERVTFYPDYSYSQFVGTYKPVTDSKDDIRYEFVPGPFLRVYVEAIKNPQQPHLLLIEEINRAKVAAVFGDVFQLLDRNDEGISEYEIQTSEDVRKYLAKEFKDDPNNWKKIRLPDNMFIWATMNSADQGVYPMDTAFKRRWNFEYCGIDEKEDEIKGKIIALGSDDDEFLVEWNKLRKAINEKLAKDYRVNEDKLIGPFFLSKAVIKTISDTDKTIADRGKFIQAFKSKVIMYLYEDAAKQHKYKLFSGCDNTKYSSVCNAFDEIGIRIFGDDFKALYDKQEG